MGHDRNFRGDEGGDHVAWRQALLEEGGPVGAMGEVAARLRGIGPRPARAYGTTVPTAGALEATAMPRSPVAGSWATMLKVTGAA